MHGQLSAIIDYYNRVSHGTSNLPAVDWEQYADNIHTPGVVDKIKAKYDEFMETEYHVDGAVSKCGVRSEAMKALDVAMHYNYHLWMTHYLNHLDQIETLHNIGDVTQLSKVEMLELFPAVARYNSCQ